MSYDAQDLGRAVLTRSESIRQLICTCAYTSSSWNHYYFSSGNSKHRHFKDRIFGYLPMKKKIILKLLELSRYLPEMLSSEM
jgi:hypothetical protein